MYFLLYYYKQSKWTNIIDNLQLATRNEHFWRSNGYNFKFIGQARVSETLKFDIQTYYYIYYQLHCNLNRYKVYLLKRQPQDLPNTVKHIAIGKYTYVYIGNENIVKPTFLLVSKEGIRHPHLLRICHCEVLYPFYIGKNIQKWVKYF